MRKSDMMIPIDAGGVTQFITGYKEQSPVVLIEYKLKEPVNGERLEKAVAVFDVFRVKLALDDENVPVYMMNPNVVEVYPYDEKPHSFGRESNGYLFRICYTENRIILSIHHMLSDFMGAHEFIKCILYFYCNGESETAETIKKKLSVDTEDFRDPYAMYGDAAAPSISMNGKWRNEVVIPNRMNYRKSEIVRINRLRFSIIPFLKTARRAESSVSPLLTWLAGMSIAETYDGYGKMIIGAATYNCRDMFFSRTPRPFSQSFVTALHPHEFVMDMNRQLTVQRARMDIEIDIDTIANSIAKRKTLAESMLRNAAHDVFEQERFDAKRQCTAEKFCYFASYLGHIDPGSELEPYIDDFDISMAVTRNPITILAYERLGVLYVKTQEIGCERSIAPALIQIAGELGMEGQLVASAEQCFDSFEMEELFHD